MEGTLIATDDQAIERRLIKLRLTGPESNHRHQNNIESVKRLANCDPYSTFGICRAIEHIQEEGLDAEKVLEMIASLATCSEDINYTEGRGYISPAATMKGLAATADAIKKVAGEGGSVVFATGHPGSMIDYYSILATLVRKLGGNVVNLAKGQVVWQGENRDHVHVADAINDVAVLSDTCSVLHSHDSRAMELMLNSASKLPNLAIADHGFAGEAINRGIPTVAVMDTNDPGLALAKQLGADIVLVPMNDTRPNIVTREAAELITRMALGTTRCRA